MDTLHSLAHFDVALLVAKYSRYIGFWRLKALFANSTIGSDKLDAGLQAVCRRLRWLIACGSKSTSTTRQRVNCTHSQLAIHLAPARAIVFSAESRFWKRHQTLGLKL